MPVIRRSKTSTAEPSPDEALARNKASQDAKGSASPSAAACWQTSLNKSRSPVLATRSRAAAAVASPAEGVAKGVRPAAEAVVDAEGEKPQAGERGRGKAEPAMEAGDPPLPLPPTPPQCSEDADSVDIDTDRRAEGCRSVGEAFEAAPGPTFGETRGGVGATSLKVQAFEQVLEPLRAMVPPGISSLTAVCRKSAKPAQKSARSRTSEPSSCQSTWRACVTSAWSLGCTLERPMEVIAAKLAE
mmetsp:Transcript_122480/g.305868  ORF Transcript_122480/g.305868 Transcript_122480/m.305868 type:complete len:244 (-) Transcript_122480:121-852(-)